ncbi:hypothetical protein D3C85_1692410 [compost metagenome]
MAAALKRLDNLMPYLTGRPPATVQGIVQSREAAAMLQAGRWIYTAALARKETRGLQRLAEYPALDPGQTHRLILSGIDRIGITTEKVPHAHELKVQREGQAI